MIEGLSKARMSSVLPIFSDCSRLFLVSVINFPLMHSPNNRVRQGKACYDMTSSTLWKGKIYQQRLQLVSLSTQDRHVPSYRESHD